MKDNLAVDMGGLDSMKDLEEDTGILETGGIHVGDFIEDSVRIGDSEVGTEELETMTEDLKIGYEDSVWVD